MANLEHIRSYLPDSPCSSKGKIISLSSQEDKIFGIKKLQLMAGLKPKVDGTGWLVAKATHHISDSGFTTTVDMEVKSDESPDVTDDEE